jgi:hypothetical protein
MRQAGSLSTAVARRWPWGAWGANGGIGVGINGAGTRAHGAPPNPHLTPPRPLRYGMGSPRPPLTLERPAARTRFRWRFAVWSSPAGAADRARDPPRPSRSRHCIASSGGNGTMKHRVVVLLVTLAALVAAAPSALAAPPTHEREAIDATFTDEESCGFPVEIHLTGFVLRIEWVDEDGSVRRIEASPRARRPLRTWTPGRASRSTPPGLCTLPRIQTEASLWLARVTGGSVTTLRPVRRDSSRSRVTGSFPLMRRATKTFASSAASATSVQSLPLEPRGGR